jgi:cytochrome P450
VTQGEVRPPVSDWATDYDIFDERYFTDPGPIWADLRDRCPIAHTERWGGSYLPTRYDDVAEMARLVPQLSNQEFIVVPPVPLIDPDTGEVLRARPYAPPISSDPPFHGAARRLILQAFSPQAVAKHEPYTRELAHRLIDGFAGAGRCDGAVEFAQQIPPKVIAHLMGLDEDRGEDFIRWVRGVLELGATDPELRAATGLEMLAFWGEEIAKRRAQPGHDFISWMLEQELDGEPVDDNHVLSTCNLLLVAGIDTTWSSIGSALWHLATHPEAASRERTGAAPDRRRGAPPGLRPRDDGPPRHRGRRRERHDHPRRQPGADELPGRQPRPGTFPRPRHRGHRPGPQPSRRLRHRDPPLRRVEPGPHGDAGRVVGVPRADTGISPGRSRRGHLVRRSGAGPPHAPADVPRPRLAAAFTLPA